MWWWIGGYVVIGLLTSLYFRPRGGDYELHISGSMAMGVAWPLTWFFFAVVFAVLVSHEFVDKRAKEDAKSADKSA